MPYATPQDLIDHLGEREALALSDREHTGVVQTDVLTRLLALAEDEANGHVGRRYALPLRTTAGAEAGTPAKLKGAVIDIARYLGTGTEIQSTEDIRNRYRDAVHWLEGVAKGTIALPGIAMAGAGGPAPTGGATAVRTGGKVFGDMGDVL
ncbi:MAG: gp436 family protein [Ramlibacter sp.]